jgi:hypothetical protein
VTVSVLFITLWVCVGTAKAAATSQRSLKDLSKTAGPHHSHRFLVAQKVQRGLAGTPLRGLGFVFEAEGHRYNVNPFFVAGITGTESSYGAARCGWNVFGWNSCNGDSFSSYADAIHTVTRSLRVKYMNQWGLRSVEAIGGTYCQCGSHWAWHTRLFMRQLGDTSGGVVYP